MGIQGLLQIIKPCMQERDMSHFAGKTAAIDIMVWLYKGAYSCSYELATGQATIEFLTYPLRMLRMLKTKGVKCICVFDGLHLAAKKQTELDRIEYKRKNREQGKDCDAQGDQEGAGKHFSRSLVLRTKMIDIFMDILKELEI
jgi:exonuclease-1